MWDFAGSLTPGTSGQGRCASGEFRCAPLCQPHRESDAPLHIGGVLRPEYRQAEAPPPIGNDLWRAKLAAPLFRRWPECAAILPAHGDIPWLQSELVPDKE